MKLRYLSLAFLPVAAFGQISGRSVTTAATVYNMRPVMFQTPCPTTSNGVNACQIVPQTGTNPAFGIVQMLTDAPGTAYPAGTTVTIATQGQIACEFDGPLQTGYTATALNGLCHYDATVVNDSQVCSNQSAFGRIQQMRPDLTAKRPSGFFGDINFRETASRGTMVCASSPGITAAVQGVQAQPDWNATVYPAAIVNKPNLSTVATTGAYSDLSGRPSLFSGSYVDLTNKPSLFSGSYADLTNKPTIPPDLTTALATETANRTSADTTNSNSIASEASTRASADTSEASARSNADTTLQANITAEATARTNADTANLAVAENSSNQNAGTLPCARMPALTGGVTTTAGSCVTVAPSQNVTYYTTAGATIAGIKRIPFSVATAANGTWSVTYTAVGCTTLRTWNVSVVSPTGTLATQQYTPYVQVANTTTMSGTVYSGAVLSLLGATLVPITVATTVTGEAVCSTP